MVEKRFAVLLLHTSQAGRRSASACVVEPIHPMGYGRVFVSHLDNVLWRGQGSLPLLHEQPLDRGEEKAHDTLEHILHDSPGIDRERQRDLCWDKGCCGI
ncbi:hypothetical protein MN608_07967 [Microdochium nivale]|nr:hypothetical protein MN608_07967 [Microdochium nivale]